MDMALDEVVKSVKRTGGGRGAAGKGAKGAKGGKATGRGGKVVSGRGAKGGRGAGRGSQVSRVRALFHTAPPLARRTTLTFGDAGPWQGISGKAPPARRWS